METNLMSTAIGSMPFEDANYAVQVSLRALDAPIWPQLPSVSLLEQMEIQYSEGIPCAVVDHEKSRMFMQTDCDYSELFATFYENYLAAADPDEGNGDFSFAAISRDYAKGIHALLDTLSKAGAKHLFLKVQTTGPASFALTIVDEEKRAIYYNEEFRDVIVKALAAKCRWQIQQFAPYAQKVICFIDEPILSAFGSSTYVSVSRDDVVAMLAEMVEAVHAEGALAGTHCCGNTEWSILIDAGVDIINFDAFQYGETIAIYAGAVKDFLQNGGILAWGVVPTSAAINGQSVERLEAQLEKVMDNLAAKGIDKALIIRQAMLTPSCGTGSLPEAEAEKVFALLHALTRRMKEKYGV